MTSLKAILLALVLIIGFAPTVMAAEADDEVELVVFWGAGCPYCADEWDFLAVLQNDYPDLKVTGYEVRYEAANLDLFIDTMAERGLEARSPFRPPSSETRCGRGSI